MRKFFLVLFPLLLAIYGAGRLYQLLSSVYNNGYIEIYNITYNTWTAFVFLFLGRVFYKGTFRKSYWVKFAYLGAGCVFLGMLFRLQHWPMSDLLFMAGVAVVAVSYIIHFIKKQRKRTIDVIKLLYLLLLLAVIQLKQVHYPYSVELSWAMTFVCLVLFVYYYIEEWKGDETKEETTIASEGDEIFRYPDEQQRTS